MLILSAMINSLTAVLAARCLTWLIGRPPGEGVTVVTVLIAGIACSAIVRGIAVVQGEYWPIFGLGGDFILLAGVAGAAWAMIRKSWEEEQS